MEKGGGVNIGQQALFLILLTVWGTRLTYNWARGFAGLHAQDWRYTQFQRVHPRLWPVINLTGIQLMPTVVVFVALLPALYATLGSARVGWLTVPAALLAAASIFLEAAADAQLRRFRADASHRGRIINRGLWRWSRHPNYLGEILFWWGIYLTSLSMARLPVWLLAGPVAVTALFLFVSIPMMEKRQRSTWNTRRGRVCCCQSGGGMTGQRKSSWGNKQKYSKRKIVLA